PTAPSYHYPYTPLFRSCPFTVVAATICPCTTLRALSVAKPQLLLFVQISPEVLGSTSVWSAFALCPRSTVTYPPPEETWISPRVDRKSTRLNSSHVKIS